MGYSFVTGSITKKIRIFRSHQKLGSTERSKKNGVFCSQNCFLTMYPISLDAAFRSTIVWFSLGKGNSPENWRWIERRNKITIRSWTSGANLRALPVIILLLRYCAHIHYRYKVTNRWLVCRAYWLYCNFANNNNKMCVFSNAATQQYRTLWFSSPAPVSRVRSRSPHHLAIADIPCTGKAPLICWNWN